jgi:hypothetical protein
MTTIKPGDYELRKFDADSLRNTIDGWQAQMKAKPLSVARPQYDRIFEWVPEHVGYDDAQEENFAYGIFLGTSTCADAIAEVTYTKSGRKWLKLLDLHLSPEIDAAFFEQTIDLHRISALFSEAVIGVVKLTGNAHPSTTVKLFARSGTLLAFFRGLGAYIETQMDYKGPKITIEGRWLVLKSGK